MSTSAQPEQPLTSPLNEKASRPDFPSDASNSPESDVEQAKGKPAFPGSDAPDGGLLAWLVVLGAWCTSFCSFGWLNSIGIFQAYYQTELLSNYSASTISWIPSLQIFFMMGMVRPCPKSLD